MTHLLYMIHIIPVWTIRLHHNKTAFLLNTRPADSSSSYPPHTFTFHNYSEELLFWFVTQWKHESPGRFLWKSNCLCVYCIIYCVVANCHTNNPTSLMDNCKIYKNKNCLLECNEYYQQTQPVYLICWIETWYLFRRHASVWN